MIPLQVVISLNDGNDVVKDELGPCAVKLCVLVSDSGGALTLDD